MKSVMFLAILAALKVKYNSMGYSAKALDAVATQLESTVTEETGIEAAVAGVEPFLKIFQSEIDTRVAAAKKPEEKKPEPPANEPAKPDAPDDAPAWARGLIETNQKLVSRLDVLEQGKTIETRRTQLETAIKDAPDAFKTATLRAFDRGINFKDDADFEGYVGEIKTDVATAIQSAADAGLNAMGQPKRAIGGGSNAKQITPEQAASIVNRM